MRHLSHNTHFHQLNTNSDVFTSFPHQYHRLGHCDLKIHQNAPCRTALAQKLLGKFSASRSVRTSSVSHFNTCQTNKLAHPRALLPRYPMNENQMPSPVSNLNCFPHAIMPTSITSSPPGSQGPNSFYLYDTAAQSLTGTEQRSYLIVCF